MIGTNEGQRDFEALRKKLEPKQNELKGQNDELENLQKQLQTQGDKLNEDARATLVKQIETKKKSFDRSVQDAQEDAQNQQKEIFQRILQKMAPVIVKHAQEGGYAMIVDTSNPWPQSPILWYGEGGDITRAVVDLYNTQSGVPAPTGAGAPAPAKPASASRPLQSLPRPSQLRHRSNFWTTPRVSESSKAAPRARPFFCSCKVGPQLTVSLPVTAVRYV